MCEHRVPSADDGKSVRPTRSPEFARYAEAGLFARTGAVEGDPGILRYGLPLSVGDGAIEIEPDGALQNLLRVEVGAF